MPPKALNLPLITFGTVLATFMQALDATIANVALPHMQGGFSASYDQISWVLTSYIVAAAIMTPPTGWLSNRYGRKKLFLVSIAGFVVASVLCGLATSIYEMVAFRILQGMGGAALVPLSQSVLLDSYPKERHGSAMAVWGMGAVVGPVLGPTLGGWLTDHYSWRWVFYINVPFGILAFLVISAAVAETKVDKTLRFDALGFGLISLAIASLQMFLDRGEQLDWFGSTEIVVEAVLAVLAFYLFVVHVFTTKEPFIRPGLFRDRNFSVSLIFISVVGVILFATMALLPPMLQGLMNYPVFSAGLLLAPRGVGTIIAMVFVGRLLQRVDARYLLVFGLIVSSYSFYWMSSFALDLPQWDVAMSGVIQGFGLGFVWVPLTTIAYSTLAPDARNEAAGVFNLMRNIGSSVGISSVVALLAQNTQRLHSSLAANITPTNPALLDPNVHRFWNLNTQQGLAALNAEVTRQASMIAYIDDFKLMMIMAIVLIPMVLLFSAPPKAAGGAAAMAME
ncbi:MAG TPA: DHA2 family efflux MFS transporter permease subunit [Alphaproteobacteria bacterium]|nr:DHA2 family efflux MFS transporter permease subunit [Alphaproteobacteria bacterium]